MSFLLLIVLLLPSPLTGKRVYVLITGSDRENYSPRAETIHLFRKRCKEITVTLKKEKAHYIIVHDDTGAGPGRKPQKIVVFNKDGDVIYSGATRSVRGAVKDACKAIRQDRIQ
ncbi:hypothetical protein LCGC14_0903440 [marine sediment metagenome]|uniref:Uncharacterized protein n=1 Tax=marine sediment metagenome TaxID=412755 RepID=A0A0F9NVQ6_9ZZZZ